MAVKNIFLKINIYTLIACFCFFIDGCGILENVTLSKEQVSEENVALTELWKTKGFEIQGSAFVVDFDIEPLYQEISYSDVLMPQLGVACGVENVKEAYWQNDRFVLVDYNENNETRHFLTCSQAGEEEFEIIEIDEEIVKGEIRGLDVVANDIVLLCVVETFDTTESWVLHLNKEGELLFETIINCVEQGIGIEVLQHGNWWCDISGNIYILSENKCIYVFDKLGNLLMKQDYSTQIDVEVMNAFHMPTGDICFAVSDTNEGKTSLVWLDIEKEKSVELAVFGTPYMRSFSMHEDGSIYFLFQSRLWKWDVMTGACELLFYAEGSHIPVNDMWAFVKHIMVTDGGDLQIISYEKGGIKSILLSTEQTEHTSIQLIDYVGSSYLRKCAGNYSVEHPELGVQYSKVSDNEDAWTQTLAELAAGKGPDIICLYADDERVQTLFEKGILMNLSDMISVEEQEQLFAGVVEAGTIDDEFIGLGIEGMVDFLIVSNQLWGDAHWTTDDVMQLIEEHPELTKIHNCYGMQHAKFIFEFLAGHHIENSPYIDWDKGISHFDASNFIKSLELAKEQNSAVKIDRDELPEKVKTGEILSVHEGIAYAGEYVEIVEKFGADCHIIGWPGQEEYVGYWSNLQLILVNAKTQYKEEVSDFLEYVFQKENICHMSGISVREDVVRDKIFYDDITKLWYYSTSEKVGGTVFAEENGEMYEEEFIEFLRRLGPEGQASPIIDIVNEEAEIYFEGDYEAGEVAKIIDNRVQLYLDEQFY